MSTDTIIVRDRPAANVARLQINRPQRANSLTAEAATRLSAELKQAQADTDVHVVLIGGIGGRAFCAGYDLGAVGRGVRDEALQELLSCLRSLTIPTVALVDGHAVGAGFDLACSCDLRIARSGIKVGLPAVRIGVAYAASGLQHIMATVPAARRLLLTGELVRAQDLAGFADLVIDSGPDEIERFTVAAMPLVEMIASASPGSVAYMLAMIRHGAEQQFTPEDALRWRNQILDSADPDAAARVRGTAERPAFAPRRVR